MSRLITRTMGHLSKTERREEFEELRIYWLKAFGDMEGHEEGLGYIDKMISKTLELSPFKAREGEGKVKTQETIRGFYFDRHVGKEVSIVEAARLFKL